MLNSNITLTQYPKEKKNCTQFFDKLPTKSKSTENQQMPSIKAVLKCPLTEAKLSNALFELIF